VSKNEIDDQYHIPVFSLFTQNGISDLKLTIRNHGGKINMLTDYNLFVNG